MNMGVTSVISALWKPRQEYQELEASLGGRTKLSIESQNLRMRKGVGGGEAGAFSLCLSSGCPGNLSLSVVTNYFTQESH